MCHINRTRAALALYTNASSPVLVSRDCVCVICVSLSLVSRFVRRHGSRAMVLLAMYSLTVVTVTRGVVPWRASELVLRESDTNPTALKYGAAWESWVRVCLSRARATGHEPNRALRQYLLLWGVEWNTRTARRRPQPRVMVAHPTDWTHNGTIHPRHAARPE